MFSGLVLAAAFFPATSGAGQKIPGVPAPNPVADTNAEVVDGHARFTVLTPQLIRMEWAADGKFEDRPSLVFIDRHLPVPSFKQELRSNELSIRTSALELHYAPAPGSDGRFTAANLSVKLSLNGQWVVWHPGMVDGGNLLGTTRTLDDMRGDQALPAMEPGLISSDGWTVVDDSSRPLFDSGDFRFAKGEKSEWPWVALRTPVERQDLYFFGYGHDYRSALGDYVKIAGRIPIPPRFAFGIWWSRYWAYTDQDLERVIRGFRENDVPLDVLVIDMDWHPTFGTDFSVLDQSGHTKGWSGYSWNRLLFPDPDAFLKRVHDQGVRVTLNMHPASGVQPWEDPYPAMATAMGVDPASKQYIPFDITSKQYAENYMDVLHHPLERQGVDFWWLDWQQEEKTRMPGVSPTWWLAYVHFTDQEREGKRPLMLNRWGGLGTHRYPIGFSGDVVSAWDSLAFQVWFTATAANVGYAYWSHDIGGNQPGPVGAELYTRWIQFACFSPILRTHTAKNPDSERRIWAYPEPYASTMRGDFQLRQSLAPYIYTEARRTYDTGVAFVRPLYYDSPEAKEAYQAKSEYSFGDSLVVAPITSPVAPESNLATQQIWLPPGQWVEWPTGHAIQGPASVTRRFSLQQIPVYAKAGAILPMRPSTASNHDRPVDPLELLVFPLSDGQKSSYTLYEDSNTSDEYRRGLFAWTTIQATRNRGDLEIFIKPIVGHYMGMPTRRAYELHLPGDWPPDTVIDGESLLKQVQNGDQPGWRYDGNTLTTIVRIANHPTTEAIHIRIRRAANLAGNADELDGFAGKLARLHDTYDTLNSLWPFVLAPDSLVDAMQSGDRLTYWPERAVSELQHFDSAYATALVDVRALAAQSNLPDAELIKRLTQFGADTSQPGERIQRYRAGVERALALIESSQPEPVDK